MPAYAKAHLCTNDSLNSSTCERVLYQPVHVTPVASISWFPLNPSIDPCYDPIDDPQRIARCYFQSRFAHLRSWYAPIFQVQKSILSTKKALQFGKRSHLWTHLDEILTKDTSTSVSTKRNIYIYILCLPNRELLVADSLRTAGRPQLLSLSKELLFQYSYIPWEIRTVSGCNGTIVS